MPELPKAPKIEVEKNIYQKLQQGVRFPISKMSLKKSGYNDHLQYRYYELGDFLPQITELLANAGLSTVFSINYDQNGIEMATLVLTDGMDRIVFATPTADVPNLPGIFGLGAKHTYCKRYLYVNLADLCETDVSEITNDGKTKTVEEKKATAKQVEMIRSLYDEENVAKMLEYYNVNSLDELSIKDASAVIKRKTGK